MHAHAVLREKSETKKTSPRNAGTYTQHSPAWEDGVRYHYYAGCDTCKVKKKNIEAHGTAEDEKEVHMQKSEPGQKRNPNTRYHP